MAKERKVLLLVASARKPRSTSEALGTYLCERLAEHGIASETIRLAQAFKEEMGNADLLAAVDRADIVVLAFPLFADSVPYLGVRAMELIAAHRQADGERKRQQLLAIVNSGFPEAKQNDTALSICRIFAREAGFEWAGGLALGGGAALNGQPPQKLGGMTRNVVLALDQAAAALAAGQAVPPTAVEAMARPLVPAWLYRTMSGFGFRQQARKRGIGQKLRDRPYA